MDECQFMMNSVQEGHATTEDSIQAVENMNQGNWHVTTCEITWELNISLSSTCQIHLQKTDFLKSLCMLNAMGVDRAEISL